MVQSNTNQRTEDPKSEASAGVLDVLKGKLCKLPAQRPKKESAATDVNMRASLCERLKQRKPVRKPRSRLFIAGNLSVCS